MGDCEIQFLRRVSAPNEKMLFEQRQERSERTSHVELWGNLAVWVSALGESMELSSGLKEQVLLGNRKRSG